MIIEHPLDGLELTGVVGQNVGVLRNQIVLQAVPLNGAFEFLQQVNTVFNAFGFAEVVVNEGLKLCVKLGNRDVEGHELFVESAVR